MYVIAKDNGFEHPITYFAGFVEDEPPLFTSFKDEGIKFNEVRHAEFYIESMPDDQSQYSVVSA